MDPASNDVTCETTFNLYALVMISEIIPVGVEDNISVLDCSFKLCHNCVATKNSVQNDEANSSSFFAC